MLSFSSPNHKQNISEKSNIMSALIGPVYKEVTLARELKDSQGLQAKFTGRVLSETTFIRLLLRFCYLVFK